MAFKELHKLKKIFEEKTEVREVEHLVVGKGPYSQKIASLFNGAVRLSDYPLDTPPMGPSTIRGQENIEKFKELIAGENIGEHPSVFFKDASFKPFFGRSKSEALKREEIFYTHPRLNYEFQFKENVNQASYGKIKEIDIIDNKIKVILGSGSEFICEKLFYGGSPYSFLKLFKNQNKLSDKMIEFCEKSKPSAALLIKFNFKKNISEMKETLFLPLSYTHEWGHFVGEFKNNGLEFVHFIDEEQVSEEDISRILKLLKRHLDKIFPEFNKNLKDEFIAIENEYGPIEVDDNLFSQVKDELLNRVLFFGETSPIAPLYSKITGVTRALIRESEIAIQS